jgi:hypothetical protein
VYCHHRDVSSAICRWHLGLSVEAEFLQEFRWLIYIVKWLNGCTFCTIWTSLSCPRTILSWLWIGTSWPQIKISWPRARVIPERTCHSVSTPSVKHLWLMHDTPQSAWSLVWISFWMLKYDCWPMLGPPSHHSEDVTWYYGEWVFSGILCDPTSILCDHAQVSLITFLWTIGYSIHVSNSSCQKMWNEPYVSQILPCLRNKSATSAISKCTRQLLNPLQDFLCKPKCRALCLNNSLCRG